MAKRAKRPARTPTPRTRRVLCTVMFTDIVDSTAHASRLGDREWKQLLDRHNRLSRAQLKQYGGKALQTVGDGFLATFDSPDQAIGCARAMTEAISELGIHIRAGLHTGQCEVHGTEISGIAVHIAKRISELAETDEVLVTQVVKDLVVGSKLPFASHGAHTLKGVPGRWRVFRLKDVHAAPVEPARSTSRRSREITLIIVDDHPVWRASLRQLLEHKRAATIVGEASNGAEALEVARRAKPDVVIMDMDLPALDGVEATRQLLQERPEVKVLFLSAADTRDKVLEAIEAGASGYLIKTASPDEIASAVRRVHGGEAVFAPSLARVVLDEFRRLSRGGTRRRSPLDALTDRERDVLKLMAEGRSNRAIAEHLHLAPKTVEAHVASIFSKLGLEEAPDNHRRVLAVVTYLRSA